MAKRNDVITIEVPADFDNLLKLADGFSNDIKLAIEVLNVMLPGISEDKMIEMIKEELNIK